MITDGKKWHYLTEKSLSILFRGITSNHMGDFIAQIVFILTLQKINLKSIVMYVKIMIIVM